MSFRRCLAFLALLTLLTLPLAACAPAEEPALCQASAVGALAEGGRGSLELQLEGASAARLVSAPEELGATLVDGTLHTKPAYGSAGEHEVTLGLSCGDREVEHSLIVGVRAPQWRALSSWTRGEGPLAREYGAMWLDADNPDRLFVFGGFHYEPRQFTPANDLWEFDLASGTWRAREVAGAVPPLAGAGVVPIPGTRAVLLYGGLQEDAEGFLLPSSLFRLSYDDDDGPVTFTALSAGGLPGVYQPALAWDERGGRYVTACGQGALDVHCEVRAFDASTGMSARLSPVGDAPSGRTGFFSAFDSEERRLIVFSGDQGATSSACDCAQDAWALELSEDPPRWQRIGDSESLGIGRRNGVSALDPVGHRMFVWGGTADGQTTFPGLFALDLARGAERWDEVQALPDDDGAAPRARSSGMAVYDAAHHRVLVGFGNDDQLFTDLWALEL